MHSLFKWITEEIETLPTIFIIVNDGCPMKRWKPVTITGLSENTKGNFTIGNLDMYLDTKSIISLDMDIVEKEFDTAVKKAAANHKIVFVPMYKTFKIFLKVAAMNHLPVVYLNNIEHYETDEDYFDICITNKLMVDEYIKQYELYAKLMESPEEQERLARYIPKDIELTSKYYAKFVYTNRVNLPTFYTIRSIDKIYDMFANMSNENLAEMVYHIIDNAVHESFYTDMSIFE